MSAFQYEVCKAFTLQSNVFQLDEKARNVGVPTSKIFSHAAATLTQSMAIFFIEGMTTYPSATCQDHFQPRSTMSTPQLM